MVYTTLLPPSPADVMSPRVRMQRMTLHFAGRVQGVGFRYTATQIAHRFEVAGYVQNLPDGRVRLVAEGAPDQLDALLRGVRDRFQRHIRDLDESRTDATDEFGDPADPDTFTVKY